MIPKIIHCCWFSDDPLPEEFQSYRDSWKRHLPGWEIRLWNRHNFDLDSIPWCCEAFQAKKYAFAADYLRLYALYHVGGVYLDSDVEVKKDFSPLLNRPYLLGREHSGDIEAGIMGAEKRAPWVKAILDHYEGRHFCDEAGNLDLTPLPKIIRKQLEKTDFDPSQILPFDFLTAASPHRLPKITKNTYSIHHFAGSWCEPLRRKDLFRLGKLKLIKIKKKTRTSLWSAENMKAMLGPAEKRLFCFRAGFWKSFVLLWERKNH